MWTSLVFSKRSEPRTGQRRRVSEAIFVKPLRSHAHKEKPGNQTKAVLLNREKRQEETVRRISENYFGILTFFSEGRYMSLRTNLRRSALVAFAFWCLGLGTAQADTKYWDGTAAGTGVGTGWDATASWSTDPNNTT